MSFIAEAKAWFFRENAPTNSNNAKIHLADKGEPDQDLFERLAQSIPFKKESDDRAKTTTGGVLESEVGIVSIGTDVEAKANTSGLKTDRTTVAHTGQLPSVGIGANQEITGTNIPLASSPLVDVTPDGTPERNNFIITITSAMLGWYQSVSNAIDEIFIDTANIRTTQGTLDGDTNMGIYTGAILTDNQSVKDNLQELESAIDIIEAGEINDAAMASAGIGTGLIFKAKVGLDLIFKKIIGGSYLNLTNGVDDITLDVDGAGLVLTLVDPVYVKNGIAASAGTGTANVYKVKTSGNIELRDLKSDNASAIAISNIGDDCVFSIQDAYFNSLADSRIALANISGTGQGSAPGYLFSAITNNDQFFNENIGLNARRLSFENDASTPYYDYQNTWIVSQHTITNELVASGDCRYIADISVTVSTTLTSASPTVIVRLIHELGVAPFTKQTITQYDLEFSSSLVGTNRTTQLSGSLGTALSGAITPVSGDKVYIEVLTGNNNGNGIFKFDSGSTLYNLEV